MARHRGRARPQPGPGHPLRLEHVQQAADGTRRRRRLRLVADGGDPALHHRHRLFRPDHGPGRAPAGQARPARRRHRRAPSCAGSASSSPASARPTGSWPLIVGFGVLAGTGIGLGYAAATPAAVKWFGPEKKGLITGIVVAGFGLAPVYIAPLSKSLLASQGIAGAFRTLGFVFLVVAGVSAQFLVNPKPGQVPARRRRRRRKSARRPPARRRDLAGDDPDAPLLVALRAVRLRRHGRPRWSSATSPRSSRPSRAGPIKAGFLFVALHGRLQRRRAGAWPAWPPTSSAGSAAMVSVFLAPGHRSCSSSTSSRPRRASSSAPRSWASTTASCLSLFPATAADYWGTKNLGLNYGILFTAWGVGGVFGPNLAGMIADATGAYTVAYRVAGGMLVFAAMLGILSHIFLTSKLSDERRSAIAAFAAVVGPGYYPRAPQRRQRRRLPDGRDAATEEVGAGAAFLVKLRPEAARQAMEVDAGMDRLPADQARGQMDRRPAAPGELAAPLEALGKALPAEPPEILRGIAHVPGHVEAVIDPQSYGLDHHAANGIEQQSPELGHRTDGQDAPSPVSDHFLGQGPLGEAENIPSLTRLQCVPGNVPPRFQIDETSGAGRRRGLDPCYDILDELGLCDRRRRRGLLAFLS
ncbi:MAG: MFS transporter [Marinilabiliales bacterium]|nr:MFS transporter [Marinilabiliales bacterium]